MFWFTSSILFLLLLIPSSCFHAFHPNKIATRELQMVPRHVSNEEQNHQNLTPLNRRSFFVSTTSLVSTILLQSSPVKAADVTTPMATFALRRAGALKPSLTNLPPSKLGLFVRFGEGLLYSDDATRSQGKDIYASFEYPADWLQLDRIMGGVQFVDQRNGDKLYVLKVKLPTGVGKLEDVPKAYIGDAIFNPKGDLVRTGNTVEDYKILSGKMITEEGEGDNSANSSIPRRRFKVRYTTLTGNNFSVERKGLIDAYEVSGMIYMLMTGSNAVLFEKKGRERDTVEYIADSFSVTPV
jgi:hypothetical protein